MKFGVDYYPEHWPEERWETDARLMREAGFNIVRLAEFAWSKMEPFEGEYDFEWLLKILAILHDHDIKAVIGTPTAAPPAWYCNNKPHVMRVDEYRREVTFGNRQQCCINQPDFLEVTGQIVEAMAALLGDHDAVYGWQIDNEFGPLCYCDECARKFRDWLYDRYCSLAELDKAWGTMFWSQTYTDWQHIPLPWATSGAPNPSLALDFRRFFSERYARYQRRQIETIRRFSEKPITHNFMGFSPEVLNYQLLADDLDFASWDNYPFGKTDPATVAAGHDTVRGYLKKNYWVMEQMSGPGGTDEIAPSPQPCSIRAWTYQSIARGADGISYFRWRPCLSGTEQYWHGVLKHDGSTSRRYDMIKRVREELARFEHLLEGTRVRAEVAFINDYDSRFAFQYQKGNIAFSYTEAFMSLYKGLYNCNIPVDILSKDWDLSRYRLVVAPAHFVLTEERATALKEYVENGGTLVMTYRSAVKNNTGLIFNEPLPGLLREVFGIVVKEYHSPAPDEENVIWGEMGDVKGYSSRVRVWLDIIEPRGARVVAEYDGGFMPDSAAITRNSFGQGTAYYIGTQPEADFTSAVMEMIARDAAVRFGMATPEGVEASIRTKDAGDLIFLINHMERSCEVDLPSSYVNLVTGDSVSGAIELESHQVAVLK